MPYLYIDCIIISYISMPQIIDILCNCDLLIFYWIHILFITCLITQFSADIFLSICYFLIFIMIRVNINECPLSSIFSISGLTTLQQHQILDARSRGLTLSNHSLEMLHIPQSEWDRLGIPPPVVDEPAPPSGRVTASDLCQTVLPEQPNVLPPPGFEDGSVLRQGTLSSQIDELASIIEGVVGVPLQRMAPPTGAAGTSGTGTSGAAASPALLDLSEVGDFLGFDTSGLNLGMARADVHAMSPLTPPETPAVSRGAGVEDPREAARRAAAEAVAPGPTFADINAVVTAMQRNFAETCEQMAALNARLDARLPVRDSSTPVDRATAPRPTHVAFAEPTTVIEGPSEGSGDHHRRSMAPSLTPTRIAEYASRVRRSRGRSPSDSSKEDSSATDRTSVKSKRSKDRRAKSKDRRSNS